VSGVHHLYVHLPFCTSRCGYCAFVVEVGGLERRDSYVHALRDELLLEIGQLANSLDTVYFGGGTPTLMGAARIGQIMQFLGSHVGPGTEVSIEANPETVDPAMFAALRECGITRVSIGAQSFQPNLLRALDRQASPEQVRRAIVAARSAGIASISIDLLFGIPGQGDAELEADLDAVAELRPDHISWYELEVKPGSNLARAGAEVDEDFTEDAYHTIVERLERSGYRWYETANFALPGHECRHNLAYWGAADYLGVGIGAVSTVGGERWRNAPDFAGYLAAVAQGRRPRRSSEQLDADTRRRERWMLALRRDEPMSLEWAGPPDHPDEIGHLANMGLLRCEGDTLRLTRQGRFLQNAVLGKLMEYA
jgi:oxygen-independent coproporphyrinogen-3 oxidase